MDYFRYVLFIGLFFINSSIISQNEPYSNSFLKQQIELFKNDSRGPYKDIRWFCDDGSIRMPKDPCPDSISPGKQHARYKDVITRIGSKNHIYLGQILAYTSPEELWDAKQLNSRLKQYQLGKYLYGVDDGWIMRKGQYYRGAIQEEDEAQAGIDFYKWLLANDQNLFAKYYLVRESLKDIPHSSDSNLSQYIRSQSKAISDAINQFMPIRVKIHGQPDVTDIERVVTFQTTYSNSLSDNDNTQLDKLVSAMREYYRPIDATKLLEGTRYLKNGPLGETLKNFVQNTDFQNSEEVIKESGMLLYTIRNKITTEKRPTARMELLDLTLKLEDLVFKKANDWDPINLRDLLNKIYYLGLANSGAGYIELWEWDEIAHFMTPTENDSITLEALTTFLETARSQVEWGASMVKAYYQPTVNAYGAFEPKSYGFIDDRVRGSIMLALGESVSRLGAFIAREAHFKNEVMDFQNTTSIRGLNPGYALCELEVVQDNPEDVEVSSNKIYLFQRPPSDLKPVAGIVTVEEGNMVSHVQLLARNLGIPNATMGSEDLLAMMKFSGKRIFYAVSNGGTVIMKLEENMTPDERKLFETINQERKNEMIAVPVDKLQLDLNRVLNMREVDAASSGNLCGPKAANLGELKKIFPEHVVEGLVIPFGIFRDHMEMIMPGKDTSYWGFLTSMFEEAERMRETGIEEPLIEIFQLEKLAELREAIKKMPLKEVFKRQLVAGHIEAFGQPLGKVPVFLRSDTNMEDLKDFTGAGLNLTLFNVAGEETIFQGIKDVWASPYTERSFKWRQKYLLNPENVFPSILVIPGVNVDFSGVLITKGIQSGSDDDLTVAFSRGAGGAVDGQVAETYLLHKDTSYKLLAPAREAKYNYLLPTGGVEKRETTFEKRILHEQEISAIWKLTNDIRERMPKAWNSAYNGAYDVELGFKDHKLWLFQIRPFVENKRALTSDFLESITPKINKELLLSLNTILK